MLQNQKIVKKLFIENMLDLVVFAFCIGSLLYLLNFAGTLRSFEGMTEEQISHAVETFDTDKLNGLISLLNKIATEETEAFIDLYYKAIYAGLILTFILTVNRGRNTYLSWKLKKLIDENTH